MGQQSLEQLFTDATKENIGALSKLLAFGREFGFQNFINRKLIWPFLLGVNTEELGGSFYEWEEQLDKSSSDYDQLKKDSQRSLANMKIYQNITPFHLQKKQKDILKILDRFFAKNKNLRYIQGFHDVASIFLILFGNNKGYYMMEKAGKTYFKDFLTKDIGALGITISDLVLALLFKVDSSFKNIFECFVEMRFLMFIVPWILTWFAHVFSRAKLICRIWDYLFCTGPHGIIYLTAGIILATKEDLKNSCSEFDHASIHTFYQQMVKNEAVDIEAAIKLAIKLQASTKIEQLSAYKNFEKDSIFLSPVFQLQIDLHRKVKQYNHEKEERKAKIIKTALLVGVGLGVAGFLFVKYGKKLR